MLFKLSRLRQLHRALVPVLIVPLLLTVITGVGFQSAVVGDHAADWLWLLDLHRGKFGRINLEQVYPFLNGLGLLMLVVTGASLWWQTPSRRRPPS